MRGCCNDEFAACAVAGSLGKCEAGQGGRSVTNYRLLVEGGGGESYRLRSARKRIKAKEEV